MKIRDYKETDRQEVRLLMAACDMGDIPKRLGGWGIVAETDEKIVGFVWALISDDSEIALVDYFCVHPSYQKKGVGIMLLNYGAQGLKDRGKTYITAIVRHDNPEVVRYYYRVGLKPQAGFIMRGDVQEANMRSYDIIKKQPPKIEELTA